MKGVTLFAAICFCLWFLSEIASVIMWIMQLVEQGMDLTLINVLTFSIGYIAQILASLSGMMFFFKLYNRQK